MFKRITTGELQDLRKSSDDFLLLNVLSRDAFRQDHIVGSENVPIDRPDFVDAVDEKVASDRRKKVVVYCASEHCDASTRAAEKLDESGFADVYDYKGGMEAWNAAGRGGDASAKPKGPARSDDVPPALPTPPTAATSARDATGASPRPDAKPSGGRARGSDGNRR